MQVLEAPVEYSYSVVREEQQGAVPYGISSLRELTRLMAEVDANPSLESFPVRAVVRDVETSKGQLRVEVLAAPAEVGPISEEPGSPVSVHSPGGSSVVSLRKDVWTAMCMGEAVSGNAAISLMRAIKNNVEGFVGSTAFAAWSDCWLSMARTLSDEATLLSWKRRGWGDSAVALLYRLYQRYSGAVRTVGTSSHVYATFLSKMFSNGFSFDAVFKQQAKKGNLQLMQSERFLKRVALIKSVMAGAVFAMENSHLFAPGTVTEMQKMLPITRKTGQRFIDVGKEKRLQWYNSG